MHLSVGIHLDEKYNWSEMSKSMQGIDATTKLYTKCFLNILSLKYTSLGFITIVIQSM